MFNVSEQFSAATKSSLEAQIKLLSTLSNTAFEGVEKIVDLNLNLAKASLDESSATASKLFGAKDAQEFFTLTAAQAQPSAEKALAYGRHLATITSATSAEFTKVAEGQVAETQAKVVALIDELSKNAPAGSENAITLFKTAIGNANAGYEQFAKGAKQVADTVEANLTAAVSQFTTAAAPAAKTTSKKK